MYYSSFFLSKEIVRKAAETAEQSLLFMLNNGLAKRDHFHVIILNPNYEYERTPKITPRNLSDGAILYEKSWGDVNEWKHDYKFYARAKALTARRHQMPTGKLMDTDRVLLLERDDAHVAGGVYEHGLAVGASGVEACLDESIAWNFLNFTIGYANQYKDQYFADGKNIVIGETKK
jgi:hypothetical protein